MPVDTGGTVAGAPPAPPPRGGRMLVPTLVTLGLVIAMVSSLGAPLIPTVATSYGVSLGTAQWVLTAALLTGALATPVMGRLADGPHQRRVILVSLVAVVLGCVLSAAAEDFVVLIIGRGLQGVGLGLLPVNMAIARRRLDRPTATRTIATLSVTTSIGVGLGYPLTGLVAQLWGFHASYWFGAVAVGLAMAGAVVVLPGRSSVPTLASTWWVLGCSAGRGRGVGGALRGGGLGLDLVPVARHRRRVRRAAVPLDPLGVARHPSTGRFASPGQPLDIDRRPVGLLDVCCHVLVLAHHRESSRCRWLLASGSGPLSWFRAWYWCPSRLVLSWRAGFSRHMNVGSAPDHDPAGGPGLLGWAIFFALSHSSVWEAFVAVGVAGLGIGFTFAAMPGFIVRAVPQHRRAVPRASTRCYGTSVCPSGAPWASPCGLAHSTWPHVPRQWDSGPCCWWPPAWA